MPLVLADRVRDTTTTTGTGTVTLSGTAPTGYQNFSVIGNGNTTYYTINAGSQWEVGIGTYSSTGPTLARTTVLKSSNANALVDFAAGVKDVFVTYPADEVVIQDGSTIQAGTSVLAVANGGTGVTTSTGTGSVVLSTSPTLTTPNLGTPSAATLTNATGLPIVAGTTGTLSVARGGTGVTTSTGTGSVVLSTSPTLTTPNLGTPSAATLTNATGLPIVAGTTGTLSVARGGTGVTTSTGTGNVVLSTSPTLVTPTLGAASATSIAAALGAVGTPSYTFTGDTNTGIYSPAADTLAFVEGGVEAMRIDSAGQVGIGATASAGTTLRIGKNLTGAVNSIGVYNNQAVQSDVTGNASLFATFPSTAAAAFTLSSLYHFNAAQGTIGATSAVTTQIGFLAQSSLTGATNNYGFYSAIASGTGRWNFYAAGTAVNYFAGNVGIGTTAPGESLVVEGATPFILVNNTDETKSGIRFADAQNTGERFQLVYDASVAAMCFDRVESTGVFTERMRIDSSGNVGIGTSAPSTRLTAAGVIRSTISGGTLDVSHDGTNGSLASSSQLLLYANGANNMIFHTNGSQRLTINSTGAITSSDLADAVGYKGIPQNAQTASYTLALSDIGKHISITTGGVVIPANGSVAFPIGSAVTIYNNSASNQTISITTDTLRLAGTATTGSRTLAQRGICTCVKVAATEWVISGAGLT